MKEQKLHQGHFGTKPQKAVKKWSIQQNMVDCENFVCCEILQKFRMLRKVRKTAKFSAILTLPLYLAPIAICFVHVASSSVGVLRI